MKSASKILMAAALACSFSAAELRADNNVKFINQSNFEIHQLYLSPTKVNQWGPDQLGEEVIASGGSFELRGVPTGKYDFKMIDEDKDECIIAGIKIASSEDVVITDKELVGCQAATASAKEETEEGEEEE